MMWETVVYYVCNIDTMMLVITNKDLSYLRNEFQ
jgi:hypothetical protein